MDAGIVKDFQKLRVLAKYDKQRMDELVQDLTNALEETARSAKSKSSDNLLSSVLRKNCKKRRGRKRRPNSTRFDGGNFSEASESSMEEGLRGVRENTTTTQQSDSDDLVQTCRVQGPFPQLSCALSLAESDSVTENFSPMRPHRRRRMCKRMAVDPQPSGECEAVSVEARLIRPKNSKVKVKMLETKHDNVMEIELTLRELDECISGKRKRTTCKGEIEGVAGTNPQQSKIDGTAQIQESSSSSLSSSESDCGIFTNDEGRDGDDEQSDFFHEPGPACGVPGIIPWWEAERVMEEDDAALRDPHFNSILTGSFELMSTAAKCGFKSRLSKISRAREIRTGRRRLKPGRVPNPLLRGLRTEMKGLSMDKLTCWHSGSGVSSSGDVKRRRQTPPDSPSNEGYVGDNADPIPETNIGNLMLRNMGWTPGTGLGKGDAGIVQPIMAYRRPKRKGLGGSDES